MKIYLIIFFAVFSILGQNKKIKVISCKEIEYYYIYNVIEESFYKQDTLIVLGCKEINKDYNKVNLQIGCEYDVETRYISQVKTSNNEYLHCSPGVTSIQKVPISVRGSLPLLVLNYKKKE